jgi:hypothetical protein
VDRVNIEDVKAMINHPKAELNGGDRMDGEYVSCFLEDLKFVIKKKVVPITKPLKSGFKVVYVEREGIDYECYIIVNKKSTILYTTIENKLTLWHLMKNKLSMSKEAEELAIKQEFTDRLKGYLK